MVRTAHAAPTVARIGVSQYTYRCSQVLCWPFKNAHPNALAGFMAGPVYSVPKMLRETLEMLVIQVLLTPLFGPLRFASRTIKTTAKVRSPSAIAPV